MASSDRMHPIASLTTGTIIAAFVVQCFLAIDRNLIPWDWYETLGWFTGISQLVLALTAIGLAVFLPVPSGKRVYLLSMAGLALLAAVLMPGFYHG